MQYSNIKDHLITYSPAADQRVFSSAYGCRFTAENGDSVLTLNEISCALGYGHPRFTAAV